jgi:protein-tyrosine-phosphatase
VDSLDLTRFDWILTMTIRQRDQILSQWPDLADRVRTVGEMAGENSLEIDDPFGGPQPVYDQTASQLQRLITRFAGPADKNF